MHEEFNALTKQHTWDVVPKSEGVNVIRCMWLFHHKYRVETQLDFRCSTSDSSLFIFHSGAYTAYLLLYVDDIVLTTSSHDLRNRILSQLKDEFSMTDLGKLSYFLGISMQRNPNSTFLCQKKYAEDIMQHANMTQCKPIATPVDTNSKHSSSDGSPIADITLYRSLAGAL
ncbi:uncharacterized mitochondrial protein AtMg00810-like [Beta vulgaris subsp. vulgaris]|uniref:uncharacterized mitochondrial protein AtMg00810-like n=1 Tax=Beta vulgaris subsp. vulgaris TaxID=3555 RepID=UPI002036E7BB|nr:uncharacterized mitochondrial protein AtMg00810-like [Beta vulgaris subsp. vulgaris]